MEIIEWVKLYFRILAYIVRVPEIYIPVIIIALVAGSMMGYMRVQEYKIKFIANQLRRAEKEMY